MLKIYLFAGLLLLSTPTILAQHTNQFSFDNNILTPLNYTPDEIIGEKFARNIDISADLLKSVPLLNNDAITFSTINTGHKKGVITGTLDGKELFSTEYKRNSIHGLWKSRYGNGHLIDSGDFYNNIPTGEWKSWYPDGILRSIRNYSSLKWFAVKDEVRNHNNRFFIHRLSSRLAFSNNNFENFTRSSSSFSSLPPAPGKLYEPPFKYCLHHGLFMNFYSNGVVKDSGYYNEGLKDGLWNEFYSNGEMSGSGSYYKGLKNSGWKYFNKYGRLTMLCEYKKGKLTHKKSYRGE